MSQAMNSPPRRREGPWGYSYEYDNSPHYSQAAGAARGPGGYYGGPPAMYGGPPPPAASAPPPEYWSYDHHTRNNGAYWGPPPSYEPYRQSHVPPPPRGPRAAHRADEQSSQQAPSHLRIPPSPRARYGHAGGMDPNQQKRGDFLPPTSASAQGSRSSKDGTPKKKGDPLSILANVSAGMTGKDGQKKQQQQQQVPLPAPTSPLQRRSRPSPITPNTTSPDVHHRSQRHQITPTSGNRSIDKHPSWEYGPEAAYMEQGPPGGYYSARRRHPGYPEYPSRHPEGAPPALVERGSFDSQGDGQYARERQPPAPYYYDEHGYGYWEGAPPAYPPPRYSHYEWYENPEDPYAHHRQPVPPYTLVQQPRLEEKTVLRKKFSWKHYPELERFLIANRDEYLKHSSMNYTAEQKQYNNWLTERLLEVASQHNYVFDPDDFNFVAIRDRIRCYYKSYVQTARKRGLKLPEKKKD